MRILQVLLSPRIGGAESAAASLAEEWARIGHSCDVVYLDKDASVGPFARLAGLRSAIRDLKPDVLISHSALPNIYTRLVAGSIPVLTVLHSATRDMDDPKLRFAERVLQWRTRSVIAVSPTQKEEYLDLFPNQRVIVIPNGVSLRFSPPSIPELDGPIVTIGRVVAQKDPLLWSAVARSLCAERQSVRFEWHGPLASGALPNETLRWHQSPESRAVLAGPTDRVHEVLRSASILFHPAIREAHSVALLEAAATGIPIVCSSEVAATLPGWLPMSVFSVRDAQDAIRAVRTVADDLPRWSENAILVARRVQEEFGIKGSAQAYLAEMAIAVS